MLNRAVAILISLGALFNPPPLESMTGRQKIRRALLVSIALFVGCVAMAILGAGGIFLAQRGSDLLSGFPEWRSGLEIILASIFVNAVCVSVLLEIRKAEGS